MLVAILFRSLQVLSKFKEKPAGEDTSITGKRLMYPHPLRIRDLQGIITEGIRHRWLFAPFTGIPGDAVNERNQAEVQPTQFDGLAYSNVTVSPSQNTEFGSNRGRIEGSHTIDGYI